MRMWTLHSKYVTNKKLEFSWMQSLVNLEIHAIKETCYNLVTVCTDKFYQSVEKWLVPANTLKNSKVLLQIILVTQ